VPEVGLVVSSSFKNIYFNLRELFLKVPVYLTFKKFSITLELSEIFFANAFNLLSGE
jgi:hypothetical protein